MAKAIVVNGRIVARKNISEVELLQVETLRMGIVSLKHRLKDMEACLTETEAEIFARLDAGCSVVRTSALQAGISEETGPRRPEWKDLYLSHMEDEHGIPHDVEEHTILNTTAGKPYRVLRIFHKPGRRQ